MTALCVPQRGEKGLLTPQQRKPGHCSAYAEWSSFTLTLPHTYTHMHTHSWPEEERWTRTWAMQWEGCSWRVSNLQLKSRKQDKIAHRAWIGGGTWASTCAACLVVKLGNKPTVFFFCFFLTTAKAQPLKLSSCLLEPYAQSLIYMRGGKKKHFTFLAKASTW